MYLDFLLTLYRRYIDHDQLEYIPYFHRFPQDVRNFGNSLTEVGFGKLLVVQSQEVIK